MDASRTLAMDDLPHMTFLIMFCTRHQALGNEIQIRAQYYMYLHRAS
jgi:hypothetical protein